MTLTEQFLNSRKGSTGEVKQEEPVKKPDAQRRQAAQRFTDAYLKLTQQKQEEPQQRSAALDPDAFISGVLEQLDKTKAQAQEADRAYQQAKAGFTAPVTGSSYAAAYQNQPTTPQPATPYGAAQQDVGLQMTQEQKDLYKRKQEADALNSQVSSLQDQATYATDLKAILSMPEDVRQALAVEAEATGTGEALRAAPPEWYETAMEQLFGRKWETQNDMKQKRAAARETLAAAGYTDEQIKNLAETYTRFQNQQKAEERQKQTRQNVDSSGLSALGQNLLAVPANIAGALTGGMGMAMEAVERGVKGSQYASLDPNLEAYKLSQYASDVRSQTRENIEEGNGALGKVGGVLYGATTSAVDNLARIAVAGPAGSLALAGLGSFQDSVRDVSSRGGNAMQAYGMGVTTAAFEILTEKISLDKLIDTPSPASLVQALKNAAIQGGIEVSEEELNFAATTIADALIMGEKSNIRQQYNQLVANGKSPQEASKQVMQGLLLDAVNVAAESFLSGGMMSAGTQVGGYLSNRNKTAPQQPHQAPQSEETPRTNTDAAPTVAAEQKNDSAQQTASQGNAAADTVDAALRGYRATGSVSNSTATRILNTPGAVEHLQQSVEFQLPGTASGNRAAVKYALELLAAESTQEQAQDMTAPASTRDRGTAIGADTVEPTGQPAKPDGIRSQLRENQGKLNALDAVADIHVPQEYMQMSKAEKINWVEKKLQSTGYQVDRKGFGIIDFAMKRLKQAFRYLKQGSAEDAVFEAIPYVLENGVEISAHDDHKERGYKTVTIAAPVVVNGQRGNMAVVVKQTDSNYYKVHRILTPDGSVFELSEENNKTEPTGSGGVTAIGSLATTKGSAPSGEGVMESSTGHRQSNFLVPTPNNSIADTSENVNTYETESVGAAPQGFDPHSNLQFKYGNQPDRANDARPVNVPKKDAYGRDVTEFAANASGAEAVPESFIPVIEELTVEGYLGHDRRTNAESLRAAAKEIEEDGEIKSIKKISKAVEKGTPREGDIAKAMLLFAQYADDKGSKSQKRAAELFIDLSQLATRAGRDLQLFKMLRKLTPQGQLMAVQKNAKQYVNAINAGRSAAKQVDVEIPQDLLDEYIHAAQEDAVTPTEESRQRKESAEQAIYLNAASQIPATLMEKWNAWRRMAMLFNPKTQLRNLAGNMAFRAYVDAKRAVGTAFEKVFVPQEQRTKSVLGTGENARKLLALAKQDASAQQSRMDGSSRAGDTPNTQIGDMRQIFNNKLLEKGRTGLMDFMEGSDMLFKRREYALSLASLLKARGYTAAQWEAGQIPENVLEEGRTYAAKEAMKATFNDQNAVSTFLSKRYKGNNPFGKMVNAAAEGVLPFRRTPANVAVRAVEYSPAGLAKALSWDIAQVKKGEMTAAECIDHLAAGLTGTGAMVLGYALANGIFGVRLVGALDDEDEERMGHQAYAIEIGDRSFTIDWLAPANIPLFVGANLFSAMHRSGEEDVSGFTAFVDAATDTLEPMLELSCLSSLNDLLQDVSYAEKGKKLYTVASSVATSYFMQGLPTLFSQWDTAANKRRQTVYQDSSDPVIGEAQRLLGRAFQKLPGDPYQTDYVDAWGRTEDQTAYGIVESLLLPFYGNKITRNTVDMELKRLNDAQEDDVSPSTPAKTVIIDGVRHRLTGKEWSRLAKTQGQLQYDIVSQLMNSSAYDSLTDQQKASVIRNAYTYAKEQARQDAHITSEGLSAKWMQQIDATSAKSIAAGILEHELQESTGMTESQYADAKDAGFSTDAMRIVDSLLAGLTPEAGRSGVTKAQKLEAITGNTDFTSEEKEKWLYWLLDDSGDQKLDAAKDLGLSAEEYAVAYRLYSDETNTGGKGTKDRIVSGLMEQFEIPYDTAEALYKVYKGTYNK